MGKKVVLSGMRPTGPLHIGHLLGVLGRWAQLQDAYDCLFMVADWHALMSEYEDPKALRKYILDNVIDWMSCGIDPKKSTIFVQSMVPQHLELFTILSDITPLAWLERCPTYKEQLREIKTRELHTYGFLGYPILQAADILVYKAELVPVGMDQLPHLELTREITRKFNNLYKNILPEPDPILTDTPKILGTDGRKMSKSYENFIALGDTASAITEKVAGMFTDPKRARRSDPGDPEKCNVHTYYKIFAPGESGAIAEACRTANIGCTECKSKLGKILVNYLEPIRSRREVLLRDIKKVEEIVRSGSEDARKRASGVMGEVREAVGI